MLPDLLYVRAVSGALGTEQNIAIFSIAFIAQLGERQTEDLEVGSSILPEGILFRLSLSYHGYWLMPICESSSSLHLNTSWENTPLTLIPY